MLKWSITPVRRLCRLFSTVRCSPGGGVGDVEAILRRKSTLRPPPPPTVKRWHVPRNSCSFIGQITTPVRLNNSNVGAYTFLEIKGPPSNQNTSSYEICISMRGQLAQVSLEYLQQEQFVYVSGQLCSYKKVNLSGPDYVLYKVEVQELSFVRTHSHKEVPCKAKEDLENENEDMTLAGSNKNPGLCDINKEEFLRERHILWQIFFANPFEWWDRRATKRSTRQPDFRHKSSGEALWIRSDDPPWVKKQLNLYDSKMSEFNQFRQKEDHCIHGWKIQDFYHLEKNYKEY